MDILRDYHDREVPVFVIFNKGEDRDEIIAKLINEGLAEDYRYSIDGQLIFRFIPYRKAA